LTNGEAEAVDVSDFARRLKQWREARGLTSNRLARLAGLSPQGALNLEAEGSDPKLSTVLKLAAALGASLQELLSPPPAGGRPAAAGPVSTPVDTPRGHAEATAAAAAAYRVLHEMLREPGDLTEDKALLMENRARLMALERYHDKLTLAMEARRGLVGMPARVKPLPDVAADAEECLDGLDRLKHRWGRHLQLDWCAADPGQRAAFLEWFAGHGPAEGGPALRGKLRSALRKARRRQAEAPVVADALWFAPVLKLLKECVRELRKPEGVRAAAKALDSLEWAGYVLQHDPRAPAGVKELLEESARGLREPEGDNEAARVLDNVYRAGKLLTDDPKWWKGRK
jgi:transcriptional regulator with XRE-family HTH domain